MMNDVHEWYKMVQTMMMKTADISEKLKYCVILARLNNINYVMETHDEASKQFNQLTKLVFSMELLEMIVSYHFGTSNICINDLLMINKEFEDFVQHSYHFKQSRVPSSTRVRLQINAFVKQAPK